MKLLKKQKFQMPELPDQMTTEAAPEQMPEVQPEILPVQEAAPEQMPEVQLSDGQTENIPEQIPDSMPDQSSDVRPLGLPQMMTNDGRYYTKDEFQAVFASFFNSLKDPKAADNFFGTIQSKGRTLASDRFYELASRYKWLHWIIDKQTAVLHDTALIAIWAATEANIIVMNYTGISIFKKVQIWSKNKIRTKAETEAKAGKRSVWAFLGRLAAEKQPKQEN